MPQIASELLQHARKAEGSTSLTILKHWSSTTVKKPCCKIKVLVVMGSSF